MLAPCPALSCIPLSSLAYHSHLLLNAIRSSLHSHALKYALVMTLFCTISGNHACNHNLKWTRGCVKHNPDMWLRMPPMVTETAIDRCTRFYAEVSRSLKLVHACRIVHRPHAYGAQDSATTRLSVHRHPKALGGCASCASRSAGWYGAAVPQGSVQASRRRPKDKTYAVLGHPPSASLYESSSTEFLRGRRAQAACHELLNRWKAATGSVAWSRSPTPIVAVSHCPNRRFLPSTGIEDMGNYVLAVRDGSRDIVLMAPVQTSS
ncbi:hypothetical protein BD414DRAFT_180150 [Trametes punicea]|nr:hypothetical protein BD414DRAFT_180150 [Trametes punicea]